MLTKADRKRLEEFASLGDGACCFPSFPTRFASRLATRGLLEPVWNWATPISPMFWITPAGREALAQSTTGHREEPRT